MVLGVVTLGSLTGAILAAILLAVWLVIRHRRIKAEGPPSKEQKAHSDLMGCLGFIALLLFLAAGVIAVKLEAIGASLKMIQGRLQGIESGVTDLGDVVEKTTK